MGGLSLEPSAPLGPGFVADAFMRADVEEARALALGPQSIQHRAAKAFDVAKLIDGIRAIQPDSPSWWSEGEGRGKRHSEPLLQRYG